MEDPCDHVSSGEEQTKSTDSWIKHARDTIIKEREACLIDTFKRCDDLKKVIATREIERYKSPSVEVRIAAAQGLPSIYARVAFRKLFQDPSPRVRAALAGNYLLTWSREISGELETLYDDPSELVRAALAKNYSLMRKHPDLVRRYLQDESEVVRATIAKAWFRHFGSERLAKELLADKSKMVREAARSNIFINIEHQKSKLPN